MSVGNFNLLEKRYDELASHTRRGGGGSDKETLATNGTVTHADFTSLNRFCCH